MSDQGATVNHDYGVLDITILEGLEVVRKRFGMYIGSTGEWGLHHLVYEVVDNSIDEALVGYRDHIEVTILAGGGVRVSGNGRGTPAGEHPTEHRPTVEIVMTTLHAGGKFGGGGYAVPGGLHGVGISMVNALSTRVDTEIRRQGFVWRMSFADGGRPITEFVEGEATGSTGTTQTFYPDPTIFETVDFGYEMLRRCFQQMAFLNKGLCITLTDECLGVQDAGDEIVGDDPAPDASEVDFHTDSYCYEHGPRDYVAFLNKPRKAELIHPEIIDFEAEQSPDENYSISLEIAMQWTSTYSESVHTYVNTINTTEGDTHEEGFRTVLITLINKYARDKDLFEERDDNLTSDDIREELTAVISVRLSESQFEGQTKTKLGNTEACTFVQQTACVQLGDWLGSYPGDACAIITKASQAAAAHLAARKTHEVTHRKGVLGSASMPGKLRDCSSKNAVDPEIFIVEGDPAGGPAVGDRDPEHRVIMPIRGRILNVKKACLDRALSSDTTHSLITAFGTGIGEDFDIVKLRYGEIVVMADADVDDQHIATFLLTLLFRYMRPLIEHGHTHTAMPPLYRLKQSNAEHEFAYSDAERDELLAAGREKGRRPPKDGGIQCYRGLGEMNDHELWETTTDFTTRILKQVTLNKAADVDETFAVLMGDGVEQRRSFTQRSAPDVRFLDI